jgi:hypothetical protein
MEQTQTTKLAGSLAVGDRILWDGVPATVTYRQNYMVAMLPSMQTEFTVTGTLDGAPFYAAANVNAGDSIILA